MSIGTDLVERPRVMRGRCPLSKINLKTPFNSKKDGAIKWCVNSRFGTIGLMRNRFHLRPKYRRAADVYEITGISPTLQRDLPRRGYHWGEEFEGWRNASPHDLAKLLFVRTQREAGIELADAWKCANDEIIGHIIYHALQIPGAVDRTAACDVLKANPTWIKLWAMNFATGRKDGRGVVAGGDYFIFGPHVPANLYINLEQAMEEATRKGKEPTVLHVIPIKPLIERFAKKAGQLAFIAEVD